MEQVSQSAKWAIDHSPFAAGLLRLATSNPTESATLVAANQQFQTLVGVDTLPGALHEVLNTDPLSTEWVRAIDTVLVLGRPTSCRLKAYRKSLGHHVNAESFQAEIHLMPVEDDTASGEQFVLITLQDCTDTHQAAQSLSQERQRLLTITAELEEGVLVVDSAMLVSQINDAAARMMGLAVADAVGRHVNDVLIMVNAQTGGNFNNPMVTAILVGIDAGWTDGIALARANGGHQTVRFCTKVIRDDDGMPVEAVLILRDLEQQTAVLASLNHQAGHDALTGLVLRAVFDERLAQALALSERHGRRSAFMLIRLQGLDDARSLYGHAATDEHLKNIAEQLVAVFRRSDTLCRFDEHHFAVVLTHLDDAIGADLLLRKLSRVRISEPLLLNAALSFYPKDGEAALGLIAHCAAQLPDPPTQPAPLL